VTVVSIKFENTHSEEALTAELSDGSRFSFSINYLPEGVEAGSWEEGRKLSGQEEEACCFAAACYNAEKIALRLIARAEQNSMRLKAKLENRGFDAAVVKTVILQLLERNFLNDQRYSELWVRSRLSSHGKNLSPLRLLVSLGKKGIDKDSSRKALEKTLDPETEFDLLLRFLEKLDISDNEKKDFSRAQLKSEGFSSAILDKYFDSL
jgi:regulatory protein